MASHPPCYEQFSTLAVPGLRHVVSTRLGGVSDGDLGTLNLSDNVSDDHARVLENRRRLAAAAGFEAAALVTAQQVHGTGLAWVDRHDRGRGAHHGGDGIPDTDGLLTTDTHVPVAILVADCAPVLLVDPAHHALAVLHAGWRGAVGGIVSTAVTAMRDRLGTHPADIRSAVGPCLCPTCLEVGEEVATRAERLCTHAITRAGTATPHLDLRAILVADLAAVGVSRDQITVHEACTRCRNDRFFSHRGQAGRAGRFGLIAWWER